MADARVANRYARSLITISQEDGSLETIYQDAQTFLETCRQNKEVNLALSNPVVPQNKKLSIARKVFQDQLSERTIKFIQLVVKHQRGDTLLPIFQRIVSQYKRIKGIVEATVYAPVSLKPAVQDQLKAIITREKDEDVNTVNLELVEKPGLLGGFMLKFEDKLLDKSVATQMETLRERLKQ